jgi:hypothetical protein
VKRIRRIGLSLVLAVVLLVAMPLATMAANPTVSITVTAEVVSITNTQAAWAIGNVATTATVYFSATGAQDDNYSQIENTGSVAVDIEIQGTNIEGGTYDWTLASDGVAGDQIYGLWANSPSNGPTYNVTVKSSSYVDITTNLAADGTYDWSMKFLGPTAFHASDDGNEKTATVTLVASKHT